MRLFIIRVIIILLFFCSFGLNNLLAYDSTAAELSRKKPIFIGINAEYINAGFQHSCNLGINLYYSNYSLSYYALGFDYLSQDKYNGNNSNYSLMGSYNFAHFALMAIPFFLSYYSSDKDLHTVITVITAAPILINNSKAGLRINTHQFSDGTFLVGSTFIRSKLDYFSFEDIDYFKYKPAIGYELVFVTKPYEITLSTGLAFSWDFAKHIQPDFNLLPQFSINIGGAGFIYEE